ncbi:MAG: undecaprenyl-phosphate glucose phosphotransferase [Candidatus Aminicenantes bacterium RBG_19FT_COMBO_58_17]|nr:MAG: undecaprenyl-phosphate glucose phosphotransferase [Candidatus Aminicenantes bacterium RBG_19FT_COMBO_58_17]
MIQKKRFGLVGLFVFSDVVGIIISFFYSYLFRFYAYIIPVDPAKGIPPFRQYVVVFPLFLATHLLIFYFQGFYRTRLQRARIDDFLAICLNAILTIAIDVFGIMSYLYSYSQGPRPLFRVTFKISHGFLAVYFVVVIFLITFLRNQIFFSMKRRYAKGLNLQNVLVVGAGEMGRAVAQKILVYKDLGFRLKGFLDDDRPVGEKVEIDGAVEVLGRLEDLGPILERGEISDVFVALDLNNYGKILETIKVANRYVVNIRLIPDLFQLLTLKANIQDLDGFPVISIDDVALKGGKGVVKRVVDVIVSSLGLIILSPLLVVVAILVKLTSPGPVFYRQERMGMDGRRFSMVKFRTMFRDAEEGSGPVMSRPGDPRMTRVGRFLRKFSIDEFPQLINVFRGEMSLIGPRPERPEFVREFADRIPNYMLRHKVKCGITGWAQVHGLRQETPIDKRIEYDFYYIQNWSLGLDLKIIWMTLRRGFLDRSM